MICMIVVDVDLIMVIKYSFGGNKMSNKNGLTKEICLFLNAAIIISCIIFSGVHVAISIALGIIFFVTHAFSIAHRADSNFYKVLFSVFSPFFFTATYLWLIYLFRHPDNLMFSIKSTYKYFFALCVLLDALYCRLFHEKIKIRRVEDYSNDFHVYSSPLQEPTGQESPTSSIQYKNTPILISGEIDTYFEEAGRSIIEKERASIGMLQRLYKIGFNRAARIMDQLCDVGVVGPDEGAKPRKVLMTMEEFQYLIDNNLFSSNNESKQNDEKDSAYSGFDGYNGKFDYMTGSDFEYFCADLLKKNNYEDVKITPASGDFGVDILASQNNILYAIQCKCYSSDIGVDAVYQVSGGMKYYKANIGIVLTNRYFTKQAIELANNIGIILWDRDFLLKLIEKSK